MVPRYRVVPRCLVLLLMAAATALALLVSGCGTRAANDPLSATPSFVPTNVFLPSPWPPEVQRVLILPAAWDGPEQPFIDQFDEIVQIEARKTLLAEFVWIDRATLERLTGQRQWPTYEPIPGSLVRVARDEYAADALLMVDLSHFRAYAPMALGLRARLWRLDDGETFWAADHLFDAGDPHVAVGAQRYQATSRPRLAPLNAGESALQSPRRFGHYVTAATFATFPPRQPLPTTASTGAEVDAATDAATDATP